jgi:divalent metal cation (Fe/Co/Zn/Cd) transporter
MPASRWPCCWSALKVWAVLATGSTAMLGSLADTALDLVASLATLIGRLGRGPASR